MAIVFALSACGRKTEPPPASTAAVASKSLVVGVVKESERSASYLAVSKQLELGGALYGYVDVNGDVQKLAAGLKDVVEQFGKLQPAVAPYTKQDFGALATTLGLTDIKAVGFSSVAEGGGSFRNRTFVYMGGERRGLMAALGGKPGPFKHVKLAPVDTAFFAEGEMDLPVLYKTIREIVAKVGGEPAGSAMEASLKKAGEAIALSVLDLIYGLKGRSAVVLRLDASKKLLLPTPLPAVALPSISLLFCVEGIAPVIEASLAKSPAFKRTEAGALHIYELKQPLPVEGLQPVLVADGSMLFIASSRAFLDECRNQTAGLAQDSAFQKALAQAGPEGNGLTYVTPRFFEQLRQLPALNPQLPAESRMTMDFVMARLPSPVRPLISVRTNLADGVLVRSYWNASLKQDIAMATVYNPVTVGLLAAMAIPAFQKVRVASQEKAVLNNLRMLAAAADQHYLETGQRAANFADIVGPTRYVKELQSIVGENYRQIRFVQGELLIVRLPDGRVMQYPPPTMPPLAIPPPLRVAPPRPPNR